MRWRKLSPTATVRPYRATSDSTDPYRHTRCKPVYASCHTVCGACSASCSVNAGIILQSTIWCSLISVASTHRSCRGTLTETPSYNYKDPGCKSTLWRRSPRGTFLVPQGKKAALRRASTQWRQRQRLRLLVLQAAIVRALTRWQGMGHRPAGLLLTRQFQ